MTATNGDLVTMVNYYGQLAQFALKMEDEFKATGKEELVRIANKLLEVAQMIHDEIQAKLKDKECRS